MAARMARLPTSSRTGGARRNAMEPDSSRPEDQPEGLEDPLQPAFGIMDGMRPAPMVQVDVIIEDPAWRRALPRAEALVRRAVAAALRESEAEGLVTVLLADDRTLRRLN